MLSRLLVIGYGLLFFSYVLAAIFVVFHLLRYSFNKSVASLAVMLFLIVTGVLLLSNAALFFAIPWAKLFSSMGISF